jgi:hypothetical protein
MRHRAQGIRLAILVVLAAGVSALAAPARGASGPVRLAYVWQDTVTLADADGAPTGQTGPTFNVGQGARLFWTADGQTLYIVRDGELFATGAEGGAAVHLPGFYSRTIALSQDAETLYYMESVSPQDVTEGIVSFPMRELTVALMDGGQGRLAGYFGRYQKGASQADLTFAALLYARDGGLLGVGRPNLWPTYGSNLFGTCCFPNPGLAIYDVAADVYDLYDEAFVPGAAAANSTRTHLAGPTTDGAIRVIDLITGGTRDYRIEIAGGLGEIEQIVWSPDDTALYLIARYSPDHPLALAADPPFPVDTRSANLVLYRLNLVTSAIRELASRPDVYGVSSLAATDRFIFAVVVDPNIALVSALNAGSILPGTLSTDPALAPYMPATHLWRVDVGGGGSLDVVDNVWGVVARPIR